MSKPAELCLYQLANGQTCRQIRLKGEQLCRHHRRLFRHSETETSQEESMERLAAKLAALDFPDLLHALYGKLSRIRTTVRSHPEAQLALEITLHRLPGEISQSRRRSSQPLATPVNFPENPAESMMRNAIDFLKTQSNQ